MPLPANATPWPPKDIAPITDRMAEWSAWYSGDPSVLRSVYQQVTDAPTNRPSQYRGGIVGAAARFWWGRPIPGTSQRVDQLHVPIAADLCQASADLLYAEPPTLTIEAGGPTQDRVNLYLERGLHTTLAEGAEIGAALGGRYQRVTWDPAMLDAPFLTTVHADAAWPQFRWDRLVAVTFWRVLARDGQQVWRHLERHELDAQGNGVVLHGLYVGTGTDLGRAMPLVEHEATRGLVVDADGALVGPRTPGLCVEYIPNQRPQRRWRDHPVGASLGRSDLDGVEGLMDALDEVYSSWMRDVRVAKARIHVPESMLESTGPGQGAGFDLDRDVYVGLNALPSRDLGSGGLPIVAQQFAIRFAEHQATAQQLIEDILRSAGYAAATFGEGPEGAPTAAEVISRERRSYLTRDRKIRHEKPAVARLVAKMLTVDAAVFGTRGLTADLPAVAFGDSVQDSVMSLAQTAQALRGARAASTETLVRMVHPDWDGGQVGQEVGRIMAEDTLADPMAAVPAGMETPVDEQV